MDAIIRSEEAVRDDVIGSFQRLFGLTVLDAVPIKRGWLNLKWKVTTESGSFLLKQYNKERYRLYKQEDLRFAFSQQVRLHNLGIPCPRLLPSHGTVLLDSEAGERFMAMEYCPGSLVPPGKINRNQIYDLGRSTGRMHRLLNDGTLGIKPAPKFIPPSRGQRMAHWNSLIEQAKELEKLQLLPLIEIQRKATETIDLDLFDSVRLGWAHRDLWADNLLFDDNRLTAILDFDRLDYDYPQLDVARAVMSCAYDDRLDVPLASAFMEGYREERSVTKGFLTKSLQLLWWMESAWWITVHMDRHSVPPARFAKEMTWLAENQNQLSALLDNI